MSIARSLRCEAAGAGRRQRPTPAGQPPRFDPVKRKATKSRPVFTAKIVDAGDLQDSGSKAHDALACRDLRCFLVIITAFISGRLSVHPSFASPASSVPRQLACSAPPNTRASCKPRTGSHTTLRAITPKMLRRSGALTGQRGHLGLADWRLKMNRRSEHIANSS
jgi:hypothetical protein